MNNLINELLKKLIIILPFLVFSIINPLVSVGQTDSVCRDITVVLDENGEANILPIQLVDITFRQGNQAFPPNARCDWSVAGDFNDDGFLDFTIAVRSGSGIVALNLGGGFFNIVDFTIPELNGYHLAKDLDNDGDLDITLVNAGEIAEGFVKIYLNDGNGNFTSTGQSLGLGQKLGIADVDNDSDPDIVVSNDQEPNKIWLNNGSASFVYSGNSLGSNVNSIGISMADIDNDGDIDAVKPENIWLNDGSGKFTLGQNLSGAAKTVLTSDLNQDGSMDIANSNGEIFINDGSGNFSLYHTISYPSGFGDDVIAFDLDRDGDNDLVFSNSGLTIPNTIWFNDGQGVFTDFQVLGTGSNNTASPGELTGDRNIDLFFPDSRPGSNNAAWISTTVIEEFCPVTGVDQTVQGLIDSLDWISQSSFNCSDIGSLAVTLQVPPLSGCTLNTSCISNITIEDRFPPNIVCRDTSILIEAGQSIQISADDVTAGSSDNCSISSRSISQSLFTVNDLGVNLETASLMDASGNTSSCSFKVLVLEIDLQATDTLSDAYIDLSWDIPVSCYTNANGADLYLEIKRLDTDQEVYSETIDDPNLFSQTTGYYSSSYQHIVGPDQSIGYELNLYIIGFGIPICESPTDQGSTDAFREPTVSATDTNLASIDVGITNYSDLLSYYKIYRDGAFIKNLSGDSISSFLDQVNFNSANSIKNGRRYSYCVSVYNEDLQLEYGSVCDSGGTFNIDFQASDLLYLKRIELSWNNIDKYGDNIQLSKDGQFLALLAADQTTYTDPNVVPGQNHVYGLTVLSVAGETEVDQDAGSTPANGSISGNIYTQEGNFAVFGLSLEAVAIINSDTITYNTTTDLNGYYAFDSLFYSSFARYTIRVIDSTRTFERNPRKVFLTLSKPQKAGIDFIDLEVITVDTIELDINLSDLNASAVSGQDRVDLSATYTAGATTIWFQIYRSYMDTVESQEIIPINFTENDTILTIDTIIVKELISLTNSETDAFPISDLSGVPDELYEYQLTAYAFVNGNIRTVTVIDSVIFPTVTIPDQFSAAPYFLLGTTRLDFAQSSQNIDGINIYRDSILIASLAADAIEYLDFGGNPGDIHSYAIKSYRNLDDVQYESSELTQEDIPYPQLFPVNLKGYTVNTVTNHIEVKWSYPLNPEFNYTGFQILRKLKGDSLSTSIGSFVICDSVGQVVEINGSNQLCVQVGDTFVTWDSTFYMNGAIFQNNSSFTEVARIEKVSYSNINGQFSFLDRTVQPGMYYDYRIAVYNDDLDFTAVQSPIFGSIQSAIVPAVNTVIASDKTHLDRISVRWEFPFDPTLTQTDIEFAIKRDGELIASVPYHKTNKYIDYINAPQPDNKEYVYEVTTVLKRNGTSYSSLAVSDTGSRQSETYLTPAVSNFSASNQYSDYVRLSWEYPDYITKANFYLVRDSVEVLSLKAGVDTLPNAQRIFFDKDASPGNHVYQIRAFIGDSLPNGLVPGFSQLQSAHGKKLPKRTIRGVVSTVPERIGVGGVKLTAYSKVGEGSEPFETVVYTNANGSYEFAQLQYEGDILYIEAELINSIITPSTKKLVFSDTTNLYTVNFEDYSPSNLKQSDSIGLPENTLLVVNPVSGHIEISWDVSNSNFDGFLVYRGLGQIDILDSQRPKFSIDSTGYPGTQYRYAIMTYWQVDDSTLVISPPDTQSVLYPETEAVSELYVIPSFLNNYVTVNWSHSNNFVDGFLVLRANDTIADVSKVDLPEHIDLLGIPTYQYKYTVIPYKKTSYGSVFGPKTSSTVNFPSLVRPQNFQVNPIVNGINLSWALSAVNYDGFRIYRKGSLLKIADRDTSGLRCYRFKEYEGIPGDYDTLTISTFVERDGIAYESNPKSVFIQYPYISPTESFNLQLSPDDSLQAVIVDWSYPDTNGIDGFTIYRNVTGDTVIPPLELAQIPTRNLTETVVALPTEVTSGNCTYLEKVEVYQFRYLDMDREAIPELFYTYTVVPYSIRKDSMHTPIIPSAEKSIQFPMIPPAYGLVVADKTSYHEVKWEHNWFDVDSFEIRYYGASDSAVFYNPNSDRVFVNLDVDSLGTTPFFGYKVRAIKTIASSIYYSKFVKHEVLQDPSYASSGSVPITDATDGIGPNVSISWTFSTNPSGTPTYKIYRDGKLLTAASINTADKTAVDPTAIAGKVYVYEVVAIVNGVPSSRNGDFGYAALDGILAGTVTVDGTSQGVPGVKIRATTYVENKYFSYETTSLDNGTGTFYIDQVYYGDTGAVYRLEATFDDNVIVGVDEDLYNYSRLSPGIAQNIDNAIFFRDKTAYIISGTIKQRYNDCPLEGIEVFMTTYYGEDTSIVESTFTDEKGLYSFVANIYLEDITKYEIEIRDIQSRTEGNSNNRTLHDFRPKQDTIFDGSRYEIFFDNLEQVNIIDFEDAYRYSIDILTTTVCGVLEESFKVNIRSDDNCIDTTINSTATGGFSVVQLPPKNYFLSVLDVNNPNPSNVVIKDYLQKRPIKLNLKDLHSLRLTSTGNGASRTEVAELARSRFTYHKTPILNETFTGNESVCSGIQDIVIKQYNSKDDNIISIDFAVEEIFNNQPCPVDEGRIVVVNEAGESDFPVLTYDSETQSFPTYTFRGGEPNVIKPFKQSITFQYYSGRGELLIEKVVGVIVLGTADIPGNDVIVLPETEGEDNTVKLPLYVLRDPPGDQSYSTLLENKTVKKSVNLEYTESDGGGFITDGSLTTAAVVGTFWTTDIKEGDGSTKTKSYELELSTTTSYSTSSDPLNVGEDADIIVGAGMAFQYGLVQELSINEMTCKVVKIQKVGVSPNQIATTWIYPVAQIKNFVQEYAQKIQDLEAGTLVLESENPEFNKEKFLSIKSNWESVLAYHKKELVPHYQICKKNNNEYALTNNFNTTIFQQDPFIENFNLNLTTAGETISEKRKKNIAEYKNKLRVALDAFCPFVYDSNTEELLQESNGQNKFWNQEILDKYNSITNFYSELIDGFLNDEAPEDVSDWEDDPTDPTDNAIIYNNAYANAFQSDAENLTVGGGATVTKELAVGLTNTNTFTQTAFYNELRGGGFAQSNSLGLELSVSVGTVIFGIKADVGAAVSTNLLELSSEWGYSREISMSFSEEQSSSIAVNNTTSYTISDDDIGDQVSITVIKTPAKNQTAYFQLFGGRSSCPYEEGTIARDDPKLNLVDAQGNVASPEQLLVPDGGVAAFPLQIGNNNPFGETRDYDVFLDPQSNGKAALVKLNGNQIGNLSLGGINPSSPLYTLLTVEQGPIDYKYNNLQIGVTPTCPEDDRILDVQDITVHFIEPCPDISINNPGNGWVMNTETNTLVVYQDFNINSGTIFKTSLEARRVGTNYWDDFVSLDSLEYDTLYIEQFYNNNNFTIPVFVVSIAGHPNIIDGDYEVRVKMVCKDLSETYSNVISGTIDRTAPFIIGNPVPSDGVFASGDEISATFNESIDCIEFYAGNHGNFTLYNVTQAKAVAGSADCLGNKLIYTINDPTINNGDSLVATVDGYKDMYGNSMEQSEEWSFIYMPLPPTPCDPPFTIYTSNITATSAVLNGVSGSNGQDYTIIGGISGSTDTVQITTSGSFTQFSFNANGLSPNTTYWWSVQTICDQSSSVYYSPFNVFTTLPECNAPLTLSHANVTATSATISWTPVATALGFEIQGREKDDLFRIAKISVPGSSSSFNANGLTPGTTYEWSVRTQCPVTGYTPLTAPFDTFKTDTLVAGQLQKTSGFREFHVSVAPNPTYNNFNIEIENFNEESIDVKVYNVVGQLLFHEIVEENYYKQEIDLSGKPQGVYLLHVQKGDQKQVVRIVKQG